VPAVLALLSSVLWGAADFVGGALSRRIPAATVIAASQGAALVGLVPLVLLLGERPDHVWAGFAAGAVGAVALGSFYAALAAGTMGVVAPVAATGAVVPVVAGLVRGEEPGWLQGVGIVVALAGVLMASGPELSGGAPLRPLLLAAVAALGFGTVMLLLAEGSEGPSGGVLVTMLTFRLAQVAVVAPLAIRRGFAGQGRSALPLLLLLALADLSANTCFAFATRGDLLSVVAVLGSLYPVVTVLLARQVYGERLQRVQGLGVVATLAGVAVLAGAS
jgi:drug/metabolite transporter (DMT)-like permease